MERISIGAVRRVLEDRRAMLFRAEDRDFVAQARKLRTQIAQLERLLERSVKHHAECGCALPNGLCMGRALSFSASQKGRTAND